MTTPAGFADPLATDEPQPRPAGDAASDTSAVRTVAPRDLWRRLRVPIAIAAVVVLTAIAIAVFRQRARTGALDPTSVGPRGSRAVAQLLRDRGVDVRRVVGPPETLSGTVVVPVARVLTEEALRRLASPADGTHVVLVAPRTPLTVLGVDVRMSAEVSPQLTAAGCDLDVAVTAGRADAGGAAYDVGGADGATVHACYAAEGGDPSLVRIESGTASVTVLGSPAALTNDRLDEEGNAALALGLLDRGAPVTWVMPRLAGTAPEEESKSLTELLPDGVLIGLLQVLIAALVAMVWRGRRLGPVVVEPLPVVVRAAEAVEGRARLYAAAKAHGRAAWNLRRGTRLRLRQRLALPSDATEQAIVEATSARSSRPPGDIARLLYGPDPTDDATLVRLAAELDSLDSEVRRS